MMHVPSSREECLAAACPAPWATEWVVGASINRSPLQALWQSILSVHRSVHHPCSSSVAILVCKVSSLQQILLLLTDTKATRRA